MMANCSNRMLKYCIIGMHLVYCVTHTEASSTGCVVWLTTMCMCKQTSDYDFNLDYLHLHIPKIISIDIYTLNNSEKKRVCLKKLANGN